MYCMSLKNVSSIYKHDSFILTYAILILRGCKLSGVVQFLLLSQDSRIIFSSLYTLTASLVQGEMNFHLGKTKVVKQHFHLFGI